MNSKQNTTKEIIIFTSCAMVLTALGIDIMLPTFSEIRSYYALSENDTQTDKIVTYFFMGQVTQILFGHLTDKYGRLPILRTGILIYILSGIATVLSSSIQWMFLFRFFAGMGAAAVLMTAIASIRDRFAGDAMARIMSLVLSIFLFTPVIAPALGAVLLEYYSWKFVFLIPPSFAIIVLIWSLRIQETHLPESRSKSTIRDLIPQVKTIITDAHFMKYVTIATLIFSILTCYVSSAERIIGVIYQQPEIFPYLFGGIGLLMAIVSYINSFFTKRLGAKKTLRIVLISYITVSFTLISGTLIISDPPPLVFFFSSIAMLMALTTAGDPNSSAMSLEFMGGKAGIAASVYGTFFFFIGSGIGAFISQQMDKTILPLAICAFVFSIVALGLEFEKMNFLCKFVRFVRKK